MLQGLSYQFLLDPGKSPTYSYMNSPKCRLWAWTLNYNQVSPGAHIYCTVWTALCLPQWLRVAKWAPETTRLSSAKGSRYLALPKEVGNQETIQANCENTSGTYSLYQPGTKHKAIKIRKQGLLGLRNQKRFAMIFSIRLSSHKYSLTAFPKGFNFFSPFRKNITFLPHIVQSK